MTYYGFPCPDTPSTCHPIKIELNKGKYFFELFGASGGRETCNTVSAQKGGNGAYTSGYLRISQKMKLFLYIGGKGENGSSTTNKIAVGGYNGGGNAGADTNDDDGSGAGGGSTDIRLIEFTSDNISKSLASRIMVASGGSGGACRYPGAPGGELFGIKMSENGPVIDANVNQTSGFAFGRGENGINGTTVPSSGAGSGYYGGYTGNLHYPYPGSAPVYYLQVASSGSSFISGHPGCSKIEDSRFVFYNTKMVNGTATNQPEDGNGAAIITFIPEISCNSDYSINNKNLLLYIVFIAVETS